MPGFTSLIILSTLTSLSCGHMFESLAHMRDLVKLEHDLEQSLNDYMQSTGDSFGQIKDFADLVQNQTKVVKIQGNKYLDSPINAYAIIKRFTDGWNRLSTIVKSGKHYEDLMKLLSKSNASIPSNDNEDIYGALTAILRLQKTYNLSTKSLVKGIVPGCQATTPLTADDCFDFGSAAYKLRYFSRSREWLEQGIKMARKPGYDGDVSLQSLLEYLAWVEFVTGYTEKALNITKELIYLAPDVFKYQSNEMHYQQIVERGFGLTEEQIESQREHNESQAFMNGTYARLCQGKPADVNVTVQDRSRLKCWYESRRDPRLLLKPIKLEMLSSKPEIYIFREFIKDYESDIIVSIAGPMLKRATVFNSKTQKLDYAGYRVAKSAWLDDHMHDVIKRVNTRASVMTGLDRECAEKLQIGNYGMGGHYETHFDFGNVGTPIDVDKEMGNRIATLLIYMNDVISGGATAFVVAGVHVEPSKGDAVFWYNLKRSGQGDITTKHAGCPVLCGNKWVANKWFRLYGNMFNRPCALDKNK